MNNKNEKYVKRKEKALICAVLLAILALLSVGCASAEIYVPDHHATIQSAVNAASEGDIIIVRDGTYNENVEVNVDHLTIRSQNGSDSTTVQASDPNDNVFEVTENRVNISGFTVTGARSSMAGIYIDHADHCNISGNNASNNYYGILLDESSNNTLTANICSDNWYGIELRFSSNNILVNNIANSNNYEGIDLAFLINSTLQGNTMYGNGWNFRIRGNKHSDDSLSHYTQNIDTSNTVDGRPIYYWVDQHDKQIPDGAGFVGVVNSTNITVRDLTLTNNWEGVLFAYTEDSRIESVTTSDNRHGIYLLQSSNNTLTNNTASNSYRGICLWVTSSNNTLTSNTASNNTYGIYVYYSSNNNTLQNNTVNLNNRGVYLKESSNNTLTGNNASNNTDWGIYLTSSNKNTIYNNYFNNTNNAWDNGNNTWNITKTAGTNIIGGPYLGGNYWSDYPGEDLDGDGLGDTMLPYNSSGNMVNGGDYRPLTMPAVTPTPTPEATTVSISPSTKTVLPGPFTVNVTVEPEVPIAGVQFDLSFNPSLLRANNVTERNLLKQGGANTYFYSGTIDNVAGTITHVASAITTPGKNVSVPGVFATIQMTAKSAAGTSTLDLSNVIVGGINGNPVAITVNDGSITISTAPWDVNGDGFVNVLDMILVGQHFGETGAPGWIPEDVNCDGVINVRDMLP